MKFYKLTKKNQWGKEELTMIAIPTLLADGCTKTNCICQRMCIHVIETILLKHINKRKEEKLL